MLGSEDDDGDVACLPVGFHASAQLNSVHSRHHEVAEDHIDMMVFQQVDSLHAVVGFDHGIVARQLGLKEVDHVIVVVDNKHYRLCLDSRRRRIVGAYGGEVDFA